MLSYVITLTVSGLRVGDSLLAGNVLASSCMVALFLTTLNPERSFVP